MTIQDSFSYIIYAFYSRYNMVWIANTENGLDPKNSVIKMLWCILMLLYMYIAPGQGQTTHWGQNFDDNRKAFSLCPFAGCFKMISSKSDFIHIFNDLKHVYSPWARAYNPLGTNFWCQQKALITLPIHCKFKKRNMILYTFLMILYM